MTNTPAKIEEEINKRFTKTESHYAPIDPGRQEYRKCGVKEEVLKLAIEEVLFDVCPAIQNMKEVAEYAAMMGYLHFPTYYTIRKAGWVLIPHAPTENSAKYVYKMYSPDKNFNRNRSEMKSYLKIVTPTDRFTSALFEDLATDAVVFAISDNDTFVLIDAKGFVDASSLLSEYTPSKRE
ncbi:hypothetical protein NEMIN01_2149 [Nematocida minor]|uniref:uncharacterized protein n=1 Tax=Nematocida minor TaxID=1912983 RepID=UPI002220D2E1|nr:uncharacterized protein NEMIN01_2149 [Nematocida minor]KAI5192682.1 hypothetical protein NEMIN01_2149 [Nematocida minor]